MTKEMKEETPLVGRGGGIQICDPGMGREVVMVVGGGGECSICQVLVLN